MIIIGAGGFAKELAEIFHQKSETEKLAFYDDINPGAGRVFGRFSTLKNESEVKAFFTVYGNEFTIGIGNPVLRYRLCQKFTEWGGNLVSAISPKACIGSYDVSLGAGCNVLDGAIFSNDSGAGTACIVYYNAVITHDCRLGNFVQISPTVSVLGGAAVGDFSLVGANAILLPKVKVGKHAMVGAGSVVSKDVPDHALVVGNPAKQIGWVSRLGAKLSFGEDGFAFCPKDGERYSLENNAVTMA